MRNIKLLDFLYNEVKNLYVMNCSTNFVASDDFLEIIYSGFHCDIDINLGVIYLKSDEDSNYLIVDGKKRILSLMLFLKAMRIKEDDIIMPILKKLKLFGYEKTIYEKLIKDEPLSYNEKQSHIYKEYQNFYEKIINQNMEKDKLFSILDRITVYATETKDENERDIFYIVNKDHNNLNQSMLIKSYLTEFHEHDLIDDLVEHFNYNNEMILSFFKAYLSPKFDCIISENNLIYDYFVKYIETIKKYQKFNNIVEGIMSTARVYKKMYHAEFTDIDIRNAFIKILTNDGQDTFSYLLELCEDYEKGFLSKNILIDICNIIVTYTNERKNKPAFSNANFDFSKMAQELNQLIYDEQLKEQQSKD